METITKILTVLLLGCSVVFGQSKKDIADFKVKYPKTEANATAHINAFVGGIKPTELTKSIPFVKGSIKEKHHYVECCDYSYTSSDYIELSKLGRLYPYCIKRSKYSYETEKKQKLFDKIILDLPESIKEDATHYLPKGTKFDIWFVIFDVECDSLSSLEFRTNPKQKTDDEPLRFRGMLDKCLINERNKIGKIVKSALADNEGYVFVRAYVPKEKSKTESMYGWVRLTDLVKQNIFEKKNKKKK